MPTINPTRFPRGERLVQADRQLVLVVCLIITVVACTVMAVLLWPHGRFTSIGIAAAAVGAAFLRLLLYWQHLDFTRAAVLLLGIVFFAIQFLSYTSAPRDIGVYWYGATILGAFFFLGARAGVIYSLFCVAAVLALYSNPELYGPADPIRLAVIVMSIISVGIIALFFELAVSKRTSELTEALHQVHHLATTDFLTGLSNRRHFIARAENLLRERGPLTAIAIDVDNFKEINDSFGHAAGDKVLRDIAQVLLSHLREGTLLGRTGGEEFVALLPVDAAIGRIRGEELRQAVAGLNCRVGDAPVRITASVGVATLCEADTGLDQLLSRADRALYAAKRDGKNNVVVAKAPTEECPA